MNNISDQVLQDLKKDGDMIEGALDQSPRTVTLVAKVTHDDMDLLRELARRYGSPYFVEVLRLAVGDALEHFKCASPEDIAKIKRMASLRHQIALLKTEAEAEPEPEPELDLDQKGKAPPAPYDLRVIGFFEKLENQGKAFLLKVLRQSPATVARTRYYGNPEMSQIVAKVKELVPYDGRGRSLPETRQAQHNLLTYLQEQGILPSPQ